MKFKYTHANKTYSVVTLKDDSILEIRRGDRTFPANNKADQQRWPSLDDWKSTWPADAKEDLIHPIINKIFLNHSSTMVESPPCKNWMASVPEVIQYTSDVNQRNDLIKTLEIYNRYLRGEHTYYTYRTPNRYIILNDTVLPVYHNKEKNIVMVETNPPVSVLESTTFYRKNKKTGALHPI
jgi:hypothetical protein